MKPRHDPDDTALKRELQAALAPDAAATEALAQRVLSQWQRQHEGQPVRAGGAALALAGRSGRRRWLIGATGLALGGALALGLWLQRPDPAMDELLQLDVLSQMAAGEM